MDHPGTFSEGTGPRDTRRVDSAAYAGFTLICGGLWKLNKHNTQHCGHNTKQMLTHQRNSLMEPCNVNGYIAQQPRSTLRSCYPSCALPLIGSQIYCRLSECSMCGPRFVYFSTWCRGDKSNKCRSVVAFGRFEAALQREASSYL